MTELEQISFNKIMQDNLNIISYPLNYKIRNTERDFNLFDYVADVQTYDPEARRNVRLVVKTFEKSGGPFVFIKLSLLHNGTLFNYQQINLSMNGFKELFDIFIQQVEPHPTIGYDTVVDHPFDVIALPTKKRNILKI